MKVLDLNCHNQHRFEGWFKSDADFEAQLSGGLIACPLCNVTVVTRMPSAPRLNLSGASAPAAPAREREAAKAGVSALGPGSAAQALGRAQAAWLTAVRQIVENTENVGTRFADEARKMHYDETPARNIRGVASRDEMHELLEEGIEVQPLPLPAALKDPLQ